MKMREFMRVADVVTRDTWDRLRNYGRPATVGGVDTPCDFYGLSFGDLTQAQEAAKGNNIKDLCCILLGLTEEQYYEAAAWEVMAFSYWASSQLEMIGKLFADLNVEPTPAQRKAGIEKLNFGLFGTLDWFCLRMGIMNHADAELIPWVRFYECMKIDKEKNEYEQRLRKVYEQQSKQQQRK